MVSDLLRVHFYKDKDLCCDKPTFYQCLQKDIDLAISPGPINHHCFK